MARLAGKAMHLVLDRWAVARPDALNDARKHRRAAERPADDRVGALIGMRNPARQLLRMHRPLAHEGKDRLRRISRLDLHDRQIDAAAVEPRGRAGLQSTHGKLELAQPRSE